MPDAARGRRIPEGRSAGTDRRRGDKITQRLDLRTFTVFNRTVNPVVRLLLRSPAHRALSGRLALITVTGRRSGRRFTFPVGYRELDGRIEIAVGWPERKRWWRNLGTADYH